MLCSPTHRPLPSTRIAVLNLLPRLRHLGWDASILFEPEMPTETPDLEGVVERVFHARCDVVVFQKVHGQSAVSLSRKLAEAGVQSVYVVCDLVEETMVAATTATIAVTDYLRSLYPPELQSRIHVVHDGIESPGQFKSSVGSSRGSRSQPLKAVLVTSAAMARLPSIDQPPPWLEVHVVGHYPPRSARLERIRLAGRLLAAQAHGEDRLALLRFFLNPRIRCVKWHPEGVYEELLAADIGIIPIDRSSEHLASGHPPSWAVKSENRLTLMMAAGLPVVATPIPAYRPIVRHGENAFFAETPRDWAEALNALRDPELRRLVGRRARESVIHGYSQERQAQRFLDVLQSLNLRPRC